ncbi:MAG: hypothetical protein NC242_10470 [Roseburia sp.]|nr:hypothetical protein [Roseburia sp.]
MKSKLTAWMMAAVLAAGAFTGFTPVQAAETTGDTAAPAEIQPVYMSGMDEYNSKVTFLWQDIFTLPENGKEKASTVKLVVSADSVVRFDVQSWDNASFSGGSSWGYVYGYTNELMTNEVFSLRYNDGVENNPGNKNAWYVLPKGTYYLKVTAHRNRSFDNPSDFAITTKLAVTAIRTKDAVKVSYKAVKGGFEVTCSNALDTAGNTEINTVWYYPGTWKFGDSKISLKKIEGKEKITVKDAGTYTFVFTNGLYQSSTEETNSVIVTQKIKDTVKPTVSGVANNKTYKKNVTIKFSDKGGGVKSATLNGKKIKSGTKVTKNGSYTLIVKDQSGNKTTVKFKIKK